MNEKNKDKISTLIAFVAGGLIGSGITLLMSPLSNRKNREKIEREIENTLITAQGAIEKATEIEYEVKELIDTGKETILEARDSFQTAVEAGKEAFEERKTESLKKEI